MPLFKGQCEILYPAIRLELQTWSADKRLCVNIEIIIIIIIIIIIRLRGENLKVTDLNKKCIYFELLPSTNFDFGNLYSRYLENYNSLQLQTR